MAGTQHIALPLKYRPMTFADVVGQEHVVRTLRHAIESGRVANAYLFIGPRGIGKTTLSRIFAKALNCLEPNGAEPCGHCVNCEEIAAGRSIDVVELDAASHNKVDDVRPIIEAVQFKPTASKYKIFIIDECHMLSVAAWNALLKTLEEPPPYVRFVFATTEGDKVLATIVSRCQRFDLRRISTKDIAARLRYICGREGIAAEEDALLAIARGAEGGMRDALSSLDQLVSFKGSEVTEQDALGVFGLVSRRALEGLAGAILAGDTGGILKAVEAFDAAGKNMRRLAAELLTHFRNLVVVQALGADATSLEATPDQIKVLAEQAKRVDAGRVFRICDQLAEMEDRLRYVLSVRTMIEMSLLRASRIATTATIEELMRAVRELRGQGLGSREQGLGAREKLGVKSEELGVKGVAVGNAPQDGAGLIAEAQGGSELIKRKDAETQSGDASASLRLSDSAFDKSPGAPASSPLCDQKVEVSAAPASPQARVSDARRSEILNDSVVNAIITAVPGAQVVNIQ